MLLRPGRMGLRQPIGAVSGGSASLFIPTDLTNLELWLDASDESSIAHSGGDITQWSDKSGNAYHATAYDGFGTPKTGLSTYNGHNVIDFQTFDYLSLDDHTALKSSILTTTTTGTTIITVGAANSTSQHGAILGGEGSTGQDRLVHGFQGGTPMIWYYSGSFQYDAFKDFQPRILVGTRDASETRGYSAGFEFAASPQTNNGSWTLSNLTIGGINTNTAYDLNGWVGEILIYNRVLTSEELDTIYQSLSAKWGIPIRTDDYDVFLLAGQSNMIGFDGDGNVDGPDTRIFEVDRDGSYDKRIILAEQPLKHWAGSVGDIGLGYTFAEKYIADNPTKKVILVPAGRGSTGLVNTADWNKGDTEYEDAIDRVNEAMSFGTGTKTFKGILWHQGEQDSAQDPATYEAALDQMISDMRADISGASASTPFILGQLAPDFSATAIKASIADTPNRVANTAFVDNTGLDDEGDNIHYDAASLRILGQRYYDAFLTL